MTKMLITKGDLEVSEYWGGEECGMRIALSRRDNMLTLSLLEANAIAPAIAKFVEEEMQRRQAPIQARLQNLSNAAKIYLLGKLAVNPEILSIEFDWDCAIEAAIEEASQ